MEDRDAAPMASMSDCARERAESERDVPELVRDLECERDPVPEREREPVERWCEIPLPLRRRLARDARGLGPADSRPTLSCCSASSIEPSASGTSISDSSCIISLSESNCDRGICPNVIDVSANTLSVRVRARGRPLAVAAGVGEPGEDGMTGTVPALALRCT